MVMLYFGGFVLLWSAIAAALIAGTDLAAPTSVLPFRGVHPWLVPGIVALALHAALIVLLAWRAARWYFRHGPFAVVLAGGPLIAPSSTTCGSSLRSSDVIALLHLWLACLPEKRGSCSLRRRAYAPNEPQGPSTAATKS
jgi:hypothetical protein